MSTQGKRHGLLGDAQVSRDAGGGLISGRYGDIYFQPEHGPAEAEAVFLSGCDLPGRWRNRPTFVIGETGFGTGLNFLCTWHAWRKNRQPDQQLHYVSVEGHPLSAAELSDIHGAWPQLAPLSGQLRQTLDAATPGFHRYHLKDGVCLTLLLGDVLDQLEQLEAEVDAWFLDGFAPAHNPAMWSDAVLREVGRLSAPGATLATFTAAGVVRRGLSAAGFAVRKTAGFGRKRERLLGTFSGQPKSRCPGWFRPPAAAARGPVRIRGSGVAGRSVAVALKRRGIAARLEDRGGRASDNPSLSVMPRLEAGDGPAGRWYWLAYRYALRFWRQTTGFRAHGALLLAEDAADLDRQRQIEAIWAPPPEQLSVLDGGSAAEVAGVSLPDNTGGLWFPEAGTVVDYGSSRPKEEDGESTAPETLIWAPGAGAWPGAEDLKLSRWHGHCLRYQARPSAAALRCSLHRGKYLHPVDQQQQLWAGASFTREPEAGERDRLADEVQRAFPFLDGPVSGSWSGWRAATPDRLPAAGPRLDGPASRPRLRWLRGGPEGEPVAWVDSEFVIGGLGARGFTSAPLLAEWLVSLLTREPWPIPRDLALAVASSRFLARDLKRGKG
ncbi:MAG: tRNA (5-methylaminomethyl-2-thiouridine)(34)-methyltransferase MnmD [Pseudomonadota bacterium]